MINARIYKNEQGNISLFVLGALSALMILFVVVLNMGSALAVKERAATTAKQASLAASSAFYEQVEDAIDMYNYDTWEGIIFNFFLDFDQQLLDKKNALLQNANYADWSDNELNLEALDQVLSNALRHSELRPVLVEILNTPIIMESAVEEARQTILNNGGTLNGATLSVHNRQIHIRAANKFNFTAKDDFLSSIKKNIYRESSGPKINFITYIVPDGYTRNLD